MLDKKEELKKEQVKLSQEVILRDEFDKIKLVAGADCTYFDNNSKVIAVVVVCEYKSMKVVEWKHAIVDAKIPYVPGFLGYREGPAIVEAFGKLERRPDVMIVDGTGIMHPRKMGLASHTGLMLDISTVGIGKSMLCGELNKNKVYIGNDLVGIKVTTKEHGNPIFVSPGHKITIGSSLDLIEHSIRPPHKLPEPLHQAHKLAKKLQRQNE